jgi:glycosyltransferase involved in cell wall biosynthesis
MKIKVFGVVVTTQDKLYEVSRLIDSIENSNGSYLFKVVFVNQTGTIFSKDTTLDLYIINTPKIGLSFARNIALLNLQADCYCFPDDDCIYYRDTFVNVEKAFLKIDKPSLVIGIIYDKLSGATYNNRKNISSRQLSPYNFYRFSSSVTIFSLNKISFDENLGIGSKNGSCEDAKYVHDSFAHGTVFYDNEIQVWHPLHSPVSHNRTIQYGLGYGAFCGKLSKFLGAYYLSLGVMYCVYLMLKSFTSPKEFSRNFYSLMARIKGYLNAS